MPIIKKDEFIDAQGIIKNLQDIRKEISLLKEESKELHVQTRNVNKEGTGAEAKKRIDLTKQLETATAKLAASQTKEAQQLAKLKALQSEENKILQTQAKEALGLTGAYEKQSRQLNEMRKAYKDLILIQGKETKQSIKLRNEIQKLDTQLKKVDTTVGQSQRFVGEYGRALKNVGSQLLGAAGIVGGVQALTSILKSGLKVYKDFEKSSSNLAAILGKTKNEISDLTEQAKQLGATTAFTASQVIEADTELAKLGLTTEQIKQSIPGILDLAAATGQDLASSAELAAATLRIFNLDASEMGRVTDVLAKSTTISSLSMEKLATIMPTVGKTAQLAGVSLEETAALAGTLTDRGLDASTAATSLRNIFLELSNKGLTWNQAMERINNSTDKNKTAMDLFGKRAAAAGSILSETADSTANLTTQLENANGAAKQMADTMLDNLAGDMTIAQSAWEGFILSLEDGNGKISKILRNITQWFTGLLERVTNFNNESAKLSQWERDKLGITQKTNDVITKQNKILQSIEDKDEKRQAAIERYGKVQKLISQESLNALSAKDKGDDKALFKSQLLLDSYNLILDNLKSYIPELNKSTTSTEVDTNITRVNTEEQKKRARELEKQNRALEKQIKLQSQRLQSLSKDVAKAEAPEDTDVFFESIDKTAETEAKRAETVLDFQDSLNAQRLEKEKLYQEALKELALSSYEEVAGLISEGIESNAQQEIDALKSKTETEKKILEQQLQDGLITEEEFRKKSEELDKRAANESAKIEKKAALYKIAVDTAVGVVKALASSGPPANFINAALVAAQGILQAALVSARPLPSFGKGGEIQGKPHSQGGVNINAEGGEFMLSKQAYANAPLTAKAINDGLLTDSDIIKNGTMKNMSKKEYNFDRLLKEQQKTNAYLSNGASQIDNGEFIKVIYANGQTVIYPKK